jgi:hypothetical protein
MLIPRWIRLRHGKRLPVWVWVTFPHGIDKDATGLGFAMNCWWHLMSDNPSARRPIQAT